MSRKHFTSASTSCVQAGEGGGYTGDISASVLIPAVIDAVKGHSFPLTSQPMWVISTCAVYVVHGLVASLVYGAQDGPCGSTRASLRRRMWAQWQCERTRLPFSAWTTATLRTVIYTGRSHSGCGRRRTSRTGSSGGDQGEAEKHLEKSVQAVLFLTNQISFVSYPRLSNNRIRIRFRSH